MCTWDWLCICFVWYVPSPSVDWSWLPSMLCALMCGKTRSKSPLSGRRRLAECLLIVSLLFMYDIIVSLLLFTHNISLMQVWTFFNISRQSSFPLAPRTWTASAARSLFIQSPAIAKPLLLHAGRISPASGGCCYSVFLYFSQLTTAWKPFFHPPKNVSLSE